MKVTGVVTERDSLRSQYLHMKPNLFFGVIGILLVALGVFVLVVSFSIWLFLAVIYLVLHFGVYLPHRTKKIFNESTTRKNEIELEINESGLSCKTSRGLSELYWSDIFKWRRGKSMVLIYLNSAMFIVVPLHFFSSLNEFDSFCNFIETNVGKST